MNSIQYAGAEITSLIVTACCLENLNFVDENLDQLQHYINNLIVQNSEHHFHWRENFCNLAVGLHIYSHVWTIVVLVAKGLVTKEESGFHALEEKFVIFLICLFSRGKTNDKQASDKCESNFHSLFK